MTPSARGSTPPYETKLRPKGPLAYLLWASAAVPAVLGVGFGTAALFSSELSPLAKVGTFALFAVVLGIVLPLVLVRAHVRVRIDEEAVRASLWPMRPTAVALVDIDHVAVEEVAPLRDYGGWGVKGTKRDRLYGMSGSVGARITSTDDAGQRYLTILSDDAASLVREIDQRRR